MKKLLAMILALVMALSCTLALAEESSGFQGMTISSTLDVDREVASNLMTMLGVEEEILPTANAIIALLDSLNETVVIAGNGVQYTMGLNGNDVLSMGCGLGEAGISLVSTLFPNYVITASMETILNTLKGALSSIGAEAAKSLESLEGLDINALTETINGYVEPFMNTCTASVSIGDAEVGEFFEYEGHTFNAKTPLTVDVKAIIEAYNTMSDQLMADETIKGALETLQGAGITIDPSEAEPMDPEAAPVVDGAIYTFVDDEGNSSDEVYVVVNVTPKETDEAATVVHVLVLGDNVYVTVEATGAGTARFTKEDIQDGVAMRLDVDAAGMYFGFTFDTTATEEIVSNCKLFVLDAEKPLASATMSIVLAGELTMDVTGEGKTAVAVEDLMGENASDVATGLLMDVLMNGLGGLMTGISDNVPEMGEVLNSIMSSVMAA